MTREEAIGILEYDKRAYQELKKAEVRNGTLSGDGGNITGTWEGDLSREYQRQIDAMDMAIEALEQEPRKGHWKVIPCGNNHGEYRPPKYACSECGWTIDLCRGLQQDTGHRLFCEHCGARMEGET